MVTTVAGDDRDLHSREVTGAMETACSPRVFQQRVNRDRVPDDRDHFDSLAVSESGTSPVTATRRDFIAESMMPAMRRFA